MSKSGVMADTSFGVDVLLQSRSSACCDGEPRRRCTATMVRALAAFLAAEAWETRPDGATWPVPVRTVGDFRRCRVRVHGRVSGSLAASVADPHRETVAAGSRSGNDQFGEAGQRVVQMVGGEGWELDLLTHRLGYRGPIVREPDLGHGRAERSQVVAPDPALEPEVAVAWVVAWLPGDGCGGSKHLDPTAIS